jgi:hypothetical protein
MSATTITHSARQLEHHLDLHAEMSVTAWPALELQGLSGWLGQQGPVPSGC